MPYVLTQRVGAPITAFSSFCRHNCEFGGVLGIPIRALAEALPYRPKLIMG